MKRSFVLAVCCLGALALARPSAAQGLFTGKIGGGFTEPVWDIGNRLNRGWNVTAGAGVNLTREGHVGVLGEFNYNRFGLSNGALNAANVPGGDMSLWSFTANPRVRLNPRGKVDFYLIGGGGVYHRTIDFTAPGFSNITAFDPFFGILFPATISTTQVLASRSNTKGGLNGGAGFEIKLGQGNAKFFGEARYHHMYTRPTATTFVPVTFGFSW